MSLYVFASAPDFVPSVTVDDFKQLAQDGKQRDGEDQGRYCIVNRVYFRTSNSSQEAYQCQVYELSDADLLQGASLIEELLSSEEHLLIHTIGLIRNGEFIDKKKDVIVRILDNEVDSHKGVLNSTKKLNISINDLRVGDVFVLETTKVSVFKEANFLNQKFVRYIFSPNADMWSYKSYEFVFINNRKEDVSYTERFFRDENDQRKEEIEKILQEGESYHFKKTNYKVETLEHKIYPFVDFATKATWEEISSLLFTFYEKEINAVTKDRLLALSGLPAVGSDRPLDECIRMYIEYVQNNITYLYNAEEMHGHIPQAIEKTLQEKAGDCKAKTVLLVALLRSLGLTAKPILVYYGADYFISLTSPSPLSFNHVIVSVEYEGVEYFVDPVVTSTFGLLPFREEPVFFYSLPVAKESSLIQNHNKIPHDFEIEEHIDVHLEKETGSIVSTSLYRRGLADSVRKTLSIYGPKEFLKTEYAITLERLCYNDRKEFEEVFSDGEIIKVSDDLNTNEIKVQFKAKLKEPHQVLSKKKVFKYYFVLSSLQELLTYKSVDVPYVHNMKSSHKSVLRIHSQLYFDTQDATTRKQCSMDNAYFSFSNKKIIKPQFVQVTSIYESKERGFVFENDLEFLKSEYTKISESNYGVGLIQSSFLGRYSKYIFFILWILFILSHILRLSSMGGK